LALVRKNCGYFFAFGPISTRRRIASERDPNLARQERGPAGSPAQRAVELKGRRVRRWSASSGVTYYEVPKEYGVTKYRYTVVNDRPVLVESQ